MFWIYFYLWLVAEVICWSQLHTTSSSDQFATKTFMGPHENCWSWLVCSSWALINSISVISLWLTRSFLSQEDFWKTWWWWQEVALPHHFLASSPTSWLCNFLSSSSYLMQIQWSHWSKAKFRLLFNDSLLLFWLVSHPHASMSKRLSQTIAPSTPWSSRWLQMPQYYGTCWQEKDSHGKSKNIILEKIPRKSLIVK